MTDLSQEPQVRQRGRPGAVWRFFTARWTAALGALLVLIVCICGIFAPELAPYDPAEIHPRNIAKPPSADHLLGTDQLGRDILSRILYGARVSLLVGCVAVGIALSLGVVIGSVSGYLGGALDSGLTAVLELLLGIPRFLLAMLFVVMLEAKLTSLMLAVGLWSIPVFARVARGSSMAMKDRDFVLAARSIGVPSWRILVRHIGPNLLGSILVLATLGIAGAILAESGLSFLGLGVQPPMPSWGNMLSDGREYLFTAPHMATFPGLAIFVTVMGFNLLGDALRDAIDPRLRTS
jgi:ABC-type dipeptide/oligopeptide/nickel transport system permease subunit